MKKKLLLIITLIFTLLADNALAAGLAEKVREHTLANGLKLLLVERHGSPTVASWIRFRVGAVDERSDERGLAHLLEHMLFKGTRTLGTTDYAAEKPLLDQIEATAQQLMAEQARGGAGDETKLAKLKQELTRLEGEAAKYVVKDEFADLYARNGGANYNAFTSNDGTTYLISLPANKLELWAAIEADRWRNAVLREFYTERNVVMEERRRSYETQPQSQLWESFIAAAFVAHPYGQTVIGRMADIEYLSRTKAEQFLRRYYAPNNAIIAIVGDFDTNRTIALVERYFGTLPVGTPVPPVTAVEPEQKGERRVELVADAEPQLLVGFHKPAMKTPDDYVFDVIDMVLADGRTSRLYKKMVVKEQLVTEVSSFVAPGGRYANLFVIGATIRAPHTVKEVEAAIDAELERLKSEPVSDMELQQILNKLEYEEFRQMGSNGGLARNLTEYEATAGSWRYLIEHRQQVAKITAADVQRVAKQYFVRENRTVGFITKQGVTK